MDEREDMNKEQKQQFIREIDGILDEWIVSIPTWADPFVTFSSGKPGLYISLTEEDEYDATIPWAEFERLILDLDGNVLAKYIPKLKRLVGKMEKQLEAE